MSAKKNIEVSREARKGVKAGRPSVPVGNAATTSRVLRKPRALNKAIRGFGKGLYPDGYLDTERKSWD